MTGDSYRNIPSFDPYSMLVQRMNDKRATETEEFVDGVLNYSQVNLDDVKELEDFCKKHNIIGVNFGVNNPKAVLERLKKSIGYVDHTPKKQLLRD